MFGTTWCLDKDDNIFIFWCTVPLNVMHSLSSFDFISCCISNEQLQSEINNIIKEWIIFLIFFAF